MRKIIAAFIIIVTFILGFLFFFKKSVAPPQQREVQMEPETVNFEASFAIFTNGLFRDFSASMYHNLSPHAYIQSGEPNKVQVRKKGVTWNDFFKTLPFKLTKECLTTGLGETFCTGQGGSLKFYLNGERNDNVLDEVIHSGDSILISFGNENEAQIKEQM